MEKYKNKYGNKKIIFNQINLRGKKRAVNVVGFDSNKVKLMIKCKVI